MKKQRTLPKVYGHNLSLTVEGIGSNNPKEYCKCSDCVALKKRRDLIYNKWYHKLKRWYNNN
jgi:hypothetical protein